MCLVNKHEVLDTGLSVSMPCYFCSYRPDDLLTNFITWRGMLTKMLCSPYNRTEPWKVAATLHNGSIYLSEIETEESKQREEKMTPREHKMCYWGLKFEDYLTSRGIYPSSLSSLSLSLSLSLSPSKVRPIRSCSFPHSIMIFLL